MAKDCPRRGGVTSRAACARWGLCLAIGASVIWGAQPGMAETLTTHLTEPSGWSLPRLFSEADFVVKVVMICLLLASIAVWTISLAKFVELRSARQRARRALSTLSGCRTLDDANALLHLGSVVESHFVKVSQSERQASGGASASGIQDRTQAQLGRVELAAHRRLSSGLGVIASIGSNSPFVGLFGTVWGIMNSFLGIAQTQTTSLTVVAPGIAEALLATAMGLFAAIPAVIFYNVLVRSIGSYRAILGDVSTQILLLVSRDADGCPPPSQKPISAPVSSCVMAETASTALKVESQHEGM